MDSKSIFETFLTKQGYALFEYAGDGLFRPIGMFPQWLASVWGTKAAKQRSKGESLRLGDFSPFLENFLVEAEEFWKSNAEGPLKSGNWTEVSGDGSRTPLEACALRLVGRRILLVENFTAGFAEQQRWLQTARDGLLEHERLMREIQKKEILLHCIIHDLSQPLSAMRGCFNCLTIGDLPDDLRPFVETGQRESQRQEQMIRGILEAFAGDLAAQQGHGPKRGDDATEGAAADGVDLAASAERAVESFSAAFREKGVRLQLDPALDGSREWYSVGDAPRVERIFGNLLENAMRYSPGGTTVTVGVEDKGGILSAFVDDQGPGLPKDQVQDKLFALFAKGKDRPGKAGLGLYFCKMTVERWGGHIGAETRASGGSRFWFRLPRAARPASAPAPRASAEAAPAAGMNPAADAPATRRSLGKAVLPLRILVADDMEVNRDLAMELLKKRGHVTVGTPDGAAAVAALERESFDIVLMDEVMPGMSGVDAMRKIREKEAASGEHQLIVGLTGNATAEDEKRLLDAGMDGFLSKPFDMHRLFDLVESLAAGGGRPAGREPKPPAPVPNATNLPTGAHAAESVTQHLTRTLGDNPQLVHRLVKSFLADAPKKLADVQRAIASRNAAQLGNAAHTLKGSIGIFGAAGAFAAAKNLEAMGRSGGVEVALGEFQTLESALHRLEQDLQRLTPSAKAGSKPKPKARVTAKPRSKPRRPSPPSRRKR